MNIFKRFFLTVVLCVSAHVVDAKDFCVDFDNLYAEINNKSYSTKIKKINEFTINYSQYDVVRSGSDSLLNLACKELVNKIKGIIEKITNNVKAGLENDPELRLGQNNEATAQETINAFNNLKKLFLTFANCYEIASGDQIKPTSNGSWKSQINIRETADQILLDIDTACQKILVENQKRVNEDNNKNENKEKIAKRLKSVFDYPAEYNANNNEKKYNPSLLAEYLPNNPNNKEIDPNGNGHAAKCANQQAINTELPVVKQAFVDNFTNLLTPNSDVLKSLDYIKTNYLSTANKTAFKAAYNNKIIGAYELMYEIATENSASINKDFDSCITKYVSQIKSFETSAAIYEKIKFLVELFAINDQQKAADLKSIFCGSNAENNVTTVFAEEYFKLGNKLVTEIKTINQATNLKSIREDFEKLEDLRTKMFATSKRFYLELSKLAIPLYKDVANAIVTNSMLETPASAQELINIIDKADKHLETIKQNNNNQVPAEYTDLAKHLSEIVKNNQKYIDNSANPSNRFAQIVKPLVNTITFGFSDLKTTYQVTPEEENANPNEIKATSKKHAELIQKFKNAIKAFHEKVNNHEVTTSDEIAKFNKDVMNRPNDDKAILFYSADKHPKNNILSNFYECPVKLNIDNTEYTFKTAEAAFQAGKCLNQDGKITNQESFNKLLNATTGDAAYNIGKNINNLSASWENDKQEWMTIVIRAKFSQNKNLLKWLIATDDVSLIEDDSTHPGIWGWGNAQKPGKNWLGLALMKIRNEANNGELNEPTY